MITDTNHVRTIALFGATGRTGRHLLRLALDAGYHVRVLARSTAKLDIKDARLTVLAGNVRDLDQVRATIAGVDAVISVLGPTENKPTFDVSHGTENIVRVMDETGVRRLIVSIGAGVRDPQDTPTLMDRAIVALLKLFSGWVYKDMKRTAEIVRESSLDWTIVRIPMLTDDPPTGQVQSGYLGRGVGIRISRQDMARFMLEQVNDTRYLGQAPVISK